MVCLVGVGVALTDSVVITLLLVHQYSGTVHEYQVTALARKAGHMHTLHNPSSRHLRFQDTRNWKTATTKQQHTQFLQLTF